MAKTGAIEKLKAMAKDRVDAKALKDFVAAGKDVPLSYKGREHVWDRKVKKYATGGSANSKGKASNLSVLEMGDMSSPAYRAHLERKQGLEGSYPETFFAPAVRGAASAVKGFLGNLGKTKPGQLPPGHYEFANARRDAAMSQLTKQEMDTFYRTGNLPSRFPELLENASVIGSKVGRIPMPKPEKKTLQEHLVEGVMTPAGRRSAVDLGLNTSNQMSDIYDRKGFAPAGDGKADSYADGGKVDKPYIGYRRAGRRPESQQDRAASANIPVAVARGLVSGTLGMPGDLESLARLPYELITGKESPTILPTSGDIEKRLPFRGASQTPVGQMFTGASQLAGGAYTGPLSGARAVMAVPRAIKRAGQDFAMASTQGVPKMFIGPKAKTWDKAKADAAARMEQEGRDPVDIWRQTGTFRGADGIQRQEISDVGAVHRNPTQLKELGQQKKGEALELGLRLVGNPGQKDMFPKALTEAKRPVREKIKTLKEEADELGGFSDIQGQRAKFALEHPDLYAAYPELGEIKVYQGNRGLGGERASLRGGKGNMEVEVTQAGLRSDPRSSMLHEMQHAVQTLEDMTPGGSPSMAYQDPRAFKILDELRQKASTPMSFEDYAQQYSHLSDPQKGYEEYLKGIPVVVKKMDRELQSQAAMEYYKRLAGEAEARATQAREPMSASQRAQEFPYSSYDVLPEDLIVKDPKSGGLSLQTVYHGSPHKFDKFDASKIGTGEGAQAYGHGLYFAESPGVAKSYQPRSPKFEEKLIGLYQKASSSRDFPMMEVLEDAMLHRTPSELIQKFANAEDGYTKQHAKAAQDFAKWYSKNEPEVGGLYTVDLPDEKIARMLDWDKPLSEQPEVIKALKGTDYEVGMSQRQAEKIADQRLREEADEWAEMTGGDPVDYSNNVDWESYVDQVRKESGSIDSSITGEKLHGMIMRDEGYRPDLFDTENYQVGTSEALRGYGIPGVKYLDRQSRQAGEGSRNFVVFPGEEDALTILERKKAGGEVKMAAGGIAKLKALLGGGAKPAKVEHPLVFPRAEPKTREEIRPIAQRVAEQMTGEFVRQNPKVTTNPVGKSRKQFERERNIPLETRNVVPEKNVPPVDYEKLKDYAIVGVPGDPSMGGVARAGSFDDPARATVELTRVGDITPDSPVPLFGGPRYGNYERFWASNFGAATPIQSNVNALGELYDAPVLGKYIKMAPDSANFAMHNLDSLLAIQRPEQLSKGKLEQLNRLIRKGSPKYGKFPGFPGFDDPVDVLLQSQLNSDLRKHIAETLTKPTITQALGLPNGQDVVAAITHPELRNLETGVSGFSIGRMVPGATLKKGESAHPTYDTDIPGQLIGRSKYPTPYEIAFPDTTAYARSQIKPGVQEFNMMKLLGPRERIDQQYVDEMKTFEELMKQYTGKKKGGAVKSGLSSIKKV